MSGVRRRPGTDVRRAPAAPPERFWGWHRLQPDWAEQLVATARLGPGDLVLDLGAGDGALTAPLAATGARVLAVELHPYRLARLRERFTDDPRVQVLDLDLLDLRLPGRRFHVVANPPWSLAKPLIRTLTVPGSALVSAHLVLQRGLVADVGRRGVAGPGRRTRFRTVYAASV
ncbi:MAG TPA: rRNA adenine N-6-methyltransferase family protein, partial [Microlunatus sp.]